MDYKIIGSIEEFNAYFHQETCHPQVSVAQLSFADLSLFKPIDFNMYCVVMMESDFGELVKCNKTVHYGEGTLFTLQPGQVVSMNLNLKEIPRGWMLAFKPEILYRTGLGRDFYMFNFFAAEKQEALKLSDLEKGIALNCFANIYAELHSPTDYLSNHMIRLGIGQLLSYCKRFFERQFNERSSEQLNLTQKLDATLENYLSSGLAAQQGQPTVSWLAKQFNLSPNYFGDVVKRELRISAQDYITEKTVSKAKELLLETNMNITEIAEELGFAYANHFTRMFTKKVGYSPSIFRRISNKQNNF